MPREQGLAQLPNWESRKNEALSEAQAGFGGNNQVYLDYVCGGRTEQTMRLVFMLFEQTPLAFANFRALCVQHYPGPGQSGRLLTYRRSPIHRVEKGRFFEAGDITLHDGTGGDSIYGTAGFEDESFGLRLRHDAPGLLSMVGMGEPNTNVSRFLVTFGPAPELDGRHVVIGRLISGGMHLETIEALPVDASGAPAQRVVCVDCGLIPGWANRAPPSASEGAEAAQATRESVGAHADAVRSSVADAVRDALAQQEGGGKRKQPIAGAAGGEAAPGAKRAAGGASASGHAAGSMMALPFEFDEGDDEDEDDDDDEGGKGAA